MKTKQTKNIRLFGHIVLVWAFFMLAAYPTAVYADDPNAVVSQELLVKGVITDQNGETVIGANVLEQGTNNGVSSDTEGVFTLKVKVNSTLVISFFGYTTQTLPAKANMKIILLDDIQKLDEVIVVGYGVQKKVNLSGAVESLKGANLSKRNTMQASQALQGMAPGVTVTSNNGRPGKEGTSIRIRGIGTLNDNNPLVLVDGTSSSIDAIDLNDVESISILKDAASAAIYGSRAANGVILITTKRGKGEKTSVVYKGSVGFSSPTNLPKISNAWDYMTLYDEAYANDQRKADGTPGGYFFGSELINTWKNATDRDAYPNSNIVKETFKKSTMQTQHYVGVSHGNEKFRSNTSFNYSWQDALTKNSNYSRYGIRSNNDYTVSKILNLGADISIRSVGNKDAASNAHTWAGEGGTAIEQLMRNPAIYATRYSNGYWGGGFAGSGTRRMIIEEELEMLYENWQDISAKLSASITPFTGLRLDMWYVPHWANYDRKYVLKTMPIYDYKTGEVSYSPTDLPNTSEQFDKTLENDVNITANYTKSLGKHDLSLLGGFQYFENDYRIRKLARRGNPFQDFEEIEAYSPVGMSNSGSRTQWALMSYFGRINYAFDNKYLLEANVRYDGSSRFANGHKWGVFPSFSGAWRFQAEEFMKDISWINNGKLRVSWGSLGNQSGLGSNYPFSLLINTAQHQTFDGIMAPGYAPINYAMQNITWESTQMTNIGLDLGFFNKKLDITFDWYKKSTNDILLSLPIPSVMGYTNSPRQNAGVIENVGWDLSISHANTVGDFYYKVTGVLSDVKNKIVDIGKLPIYNDIYIQQNGSSYNSIYGYVAEGLFESFDQAKNHPTTQWGSLQGGDIKYKNFNDDNAITASDRQVLGNSLPRWNYSLDLYGSYKGFDLSLFFQGVGKRDGYLNGWLAYPLEGSVTSLEQHMDRWNEANPNPNAPYPRLSVNNQSNNTQISSFWLTNAAYLRLKNIQIGWSMPERFLTGKGISSLRLFASGSNLLTFTSIAKGLDPEAPDQRTANAYPILKTYTFGLEIKF